MKKLLTTLAICGFTSMNVTADNMNSRTLTIGNTKVTVYRDNVPSTDPEKTNPDNNIFAIHQDGKIILVNAGLGGEDGFLKRFVTDGHKPEDVSAVLITSLGEETIGGLLIGRETRTRVEGGVRGTSPGVVFPNATLYISKIEKEFWDKYPHRSMLTPPPLPKQVISAYKDRIVTFDFDTEILPGITTLEAPKQNPNQVYNTPIFATRDIMFIGGLDVDTTATDIEQQRKSWQQQAADKKLQIAGSRLPFPAIGKLTANNKDNYTFTMAE